MTKKTIGHILAFFALVTSVGTLALASAMTEELKPVVVSGTFTAGTVGNKVIFEVRNNTQKPVHGVRMAPQSPQQYCTIKNITPEFTTLKPGETMDFTIEFSVIENVPDKAKETISLYFENDDSIKFDNRWYHINITIKAEEETDETNYKYATFTVRIEGSGFSVGYDGITYEIGGSNTDVLVVRRGESAYAKLIEIKESYEDRCAGSFAGIPPRENEVTAPGVFISGPKLTIIDGPHFTQSERAGWTQEWNWRITGKNGPHGDILVKKFCYGE
jgi:hypothetical protein